VTFLIAALGWLAWQAFAAPGASFMAALDADALLPSVVLTNVALLAFNLLPAFPMDGGRVLRALVASKWGYLRGTMVAARAGQVIAVVFIILGFRGNAILALIGFFVLTAAEGEYRVAKRRMMQHRQQMIEIVDPTPPRLPHD
jgi:stage IV sporulation protein FB